MKRSIPLIAISLLVISCASTTPAPQRSSSEDAAIRAAIENYFQGHATGDGAHFRKVFHPASKLFWMRDGKFAERTSEEYIKGAPGKPAADEASRRRRIEWIDVTGSTAVVKITLDHPDVVLTDYMSMLKVDGEWKIVNKIFDRAPKVAVSSR